MHGSMGAWALAWGHGRMSACMGAWAPVCMAWRHGRKSAWHGGMGARVHAMAWGHGRMGAWAQGHMHGGHGRPHQCSLHVVCRSGW